MRVDCERLTDLTEYYQINVYFVIYFLFKAAAHRRCSDKRSKVTSNNLYFCMWNLKDSYEKHWKWTLHYRCKLTLCVHEKFASQFNIEKNTLTCNRDNVLWYIVYHITYGRCSFYVFQAFCTCPLEHVFLSKLLQCWKQYDYCRVDSLRSRLWS